MSHTVRHIDPQCKPAHALTVPQLETIIAPQVIQEVLTEYEAWEQREKKLNMQAICSLIMALALYPQCSTREVYRRLLEGLCEPALQQEEVPTAGALCQRRQQLGVTPLRALFARLARPQALPQTRAAFRFGLRVVAVDGTLENLPDTDANRTVFPYHCLDELSRSPFPQARCVLLMECGTHVIFDAEFTAVQQGELGSVLTLVERSLTEQMLLLCDAGICCGPLLQGARRKGAHVLGRLDRRSWTKPWVRLHDGSYLVKVYRHGRHQTGESLTARVIEYQVKDPQTGQLSAPIRLITTLLDPTQYPIEALIRLYHERWELEQGIDEFKTHLCLSARTLRSQTPQGVEQELYGLLLTYFAVRTVMYAAALHADWDPDEVSFVHTINVLQRSQWRLMQASCFQRPALRQALLQEVCQEHVPPRRLRLQARVVKRTHSRYKRKWYAHLHAPCLNASFLDLVVLLI
ncbi:MAG TPA: IS4 family transposase [Ktedonobacteraceae bacterium]|nr:IS4 family transposase [Ktedonobacteraceae bacterium]